MKDAMIDFETFGNGKNACLAQVGACYFDRNTGEIGDKLKCNIDARTSVARGGVMDADTVYWWMKQSPEAIASVTNLLRNGEEDVWNVMTKLNSFLSNAECIWSHATFDFVILTETLKSLNIKPLFSFRAARDIRTLLDISGYNYHQHPRNGTHHDGLDDAIYQVQYCVAAMDSMRKKGLQF